MNNKITFFINTLSSGGAEHQLSILANMLADDGYNVNITTYGDMKDHYVIKDSITRTRIAPGKGTLLKIIGIWKYFLSLKTDYLFIFCQRNSFLALPPLFFRSRKSFRVICGERNFTIGQSDVFEKALVKFLYKRADKIISNNFSQERHLKNLSPSLTSKIGTIINYTDISQYKYELLQNTSNVCIGVFARYSPQKNCLLFCDAIKQLVLTIETPFQIHWYGNKYSTDGKENPYYILFEQKIRDLKLDKYIILHDHVTNTYHEIKKMDAIALPSLYEGFSNSIAEAICCGKPVLAGDVSDNSIMVENGENGFLFDPADPNAICLAFVSYLNLDINTRIEMGLKSRAKAESLFDAKKFINSYKKLLI